MKKRTKQRIARGFTSVTASLLVISVLGTQCALSYAGTINQQLGTSTSEIVEPEGSDAVDTEYIKSAYGELNADNLQTLIEDTYEEAVLEEEEGAVLLRNEAQALPLKGNEHITLFGHAMVQPVYNGGGANSSAAGGQYVINPYEAFVQAGFSVNDTLYQAYEKSDTTRVASNNLQIAGGPNGGGYGDPPVLGEESSDFYTDELKASWSEDYHDAAIVMLAREGGEDKELMMEDPEGISALALHQDEKDLLEMITASEKFDKVIVLLNSAFPMEVEWLKEYDVDACLWIGNPGIRGFEGVVNLLNGKANPSGRLVDTYAKDSLSSPAAHTGSQNATVWTNLEEVMNSEWVNDAENNVSHVNIQAENIYVGYKYYETRYEDAILNPQSGASSAAGATDGSAWIYENEVSYPFGYGLSYTEFEQKLNEVEFDETGDFYEVDVEVTNIGDTAGKSVVQIYAQTPYGEYERENLVEKSAIQLVGYGKTQELKPGESETVKVLVDRYNLASYDYKNAKGYILSEGEYYLTVGANAHDALNNILATKKADNLVNHDGEAVKGNKKNVYSWNQSELDTETYRCSATGEEVTNQFDDADINYWLDDTVEYLTRQDWEGTFPETAIEIEATEEMMQILGGDTYVKPEDAPSVDDFEQGADNGLIFAEMKDIAYDDPLWEKYLDQMTVEELTSQLSDMFGTPEVASVGKPANTEGDGTQSIGDNTYKEEYGDTREVCLYPSSVVEASMWNTERMARRGELLAEESLYAGIPLFWAGGGNIHRTPFGGRNGEYYSEDSILTSLAVTAELTAVQNKGIVPGIKHVAGNDTELYREGLVMFMTEQAFREGALKCFENVLTENKILALMQSFNRIGLVWSSSSKALCTQVLMNEWGFIGQQETDGVAGGAYKAHFTTSLAAGTTTYCIDPGATAAAGALKAINEGDGYILQCVRNAVKRYHYTLSRSALVNGLSTEAKVVHVTPWWETALYSVTAVFAVLTAAGVIWMIFTKRKSETVQVDNEK